MTMTSRSRYKFYGFYHFTAYAGSYAFDYLPILFLVAPGETDGFYAAFPYWIRDFVFEFFGILKYVASFFVNGFALFFVESSEWNDWSVFICQILRLCIEFLCRFFLVSFFLSNKTFKRDLVFTNIKKYVVYNCVWMEQTKYVPTVSNGHWSLVKVT